MTTIPYYTYLISDSFTLAEYEKGKTVSIKEILRRFVASVRSLNPYQPDYIFQKEFEANNVDLQGIDNLGLFIVQIFTKLSRRYLFLNNGRLYVIKERLEEWMEVQKVCPPLLICSAFFLDDFQYKRSSYSDFFTRVLIPQFKTSAIRIPYVFELENTIKHQSLLSDLHIHLNGTTETDMLWWSQIGHVEKWISSFRMSLTKEAVRNQYEQLNIKGVEKLSRHLRIAKDDLDYLANEVNKVHPFFSKKWEFYFPFNHYPILAKAAFFYVALFDMMSRGDKSIAFRFHRLILVLGEIHHLLVQQRNQKGFTQFGVIPNNDLRWSHEDKDFISRFKQLTFDNDFCFLKHLEGRFSPKNTVVENLNLIQRISKDFNRFRNSIECTSSKSHLNTTSVWNNESRLSLVAHFIKEKDDKVLNMFERHLLLRQSICRKSYALLKTARITSNESIQIKGIDAASDEMVAGPEVFAPAFRFMRNHWPGNESLKITFHAGEDFIHLLSGLRMMVEADSFLDMKQGDRIGHGTAAGIDPRIWMERIGDKVYMEKGEWMDDLIVAYYLISDSCNPYDSLRTLLPIIKNEIEARVMDIYRKQASMPILIQSWLCRKFDPGIYLLNRQPSLKDKAEEKEECMNLLQNPLVKDLFYNYHLIKECKERYKELELVQIKDGLFTVDDLIHLQDLVLHKLAKKNIALEVPISSNLSISFYQKLEEHHLQRWLKGHSSDSKLLIPAVVVGSDDPGIFMTNIYIEYARIMEYLERKGYSITERLQKITELVQLANYYSF